ncbi:MAG TPA: molybdenum cofactor guanylyltransferase [Methanothrix sp.]|nr:molybdenum cofactor guanylyltransferase [Methanothrix sp.]
MEAMRSAVILAGGNSSRLGEEKSLLIFDGMPLICWAVETLAGVADEIIIVARDERHAVRLEEIIRACFCSPGNETGIGREIEIGTDMHIEISFSWDSVPGFGPVAGLDAGLSKARGEFAFATGCDLPFLNARVVDRLFELAGGDGDYEAAVPVQPNGFFEPLHSVYHREKMGRSCSRAVERGERRIHAPLQELRVNRVPMELLRTIDPELLTFFNLNTREDLERARALWPKKGSSVQPQAAKENSEKASFPFPPVPVR